jgi:hypothetical protein
MSVFYVSFQRRIGKRVNGTLTEAYLFDGTRPIAQLAGAGNIVAQFVYASDRNTPSFLIKNGETYRIISDHTGSPRVVIHPGTGAIMQQLEYDEYGNVTNDTNPGFQSFGFMGGLLDADTGFVTTRRGQSYDAQTGRIINDDSSAVKTGDVNVHALNDPVNVSGGDPSMVTLGITAELTAQGLGAVADFLENFFDMLNANTIGADAYFHCKANCDATQRGPGGEAAAELLSELREIWDANDPRWWKRDSADQCNADRAVNRFGRDEANYSPSETCERICAPMRPPGLSPNDW